MMAKVGSVPRPGPEEDVEPSKVGDQVALFFSVTRFISTRISSVALIN